MNDGFYNNAIYWVEVDRIKPNPFQPRKEFNEESLRDLSESIRQYGVLQPLTVTRQEIEREDGGISVEYELIAGERRLRAAKLIGIQQVPVLIRSAAESDKMKLELAIIENLQREDINSIERAKAFQKLVENFGLKHIEIAKKVGKSREYVSNTLRLLALPEEMQLAMMAGKITEGHSRPLLMLADRPEQQQTLFKEIQERKLAVRETERIARRIATEKTRKQHLTPDLQQLEKELAESFGTRVIIEQKQKGGQVRIDFFSEEDIEELSRLVHMLKEVQISDVHDDLAPRDVEPIPVSVDSDVPIVYREAEDDVMVRPEPVDDLIVRESATDVVPREYDFVAAPETIDQKPVARTVDSPLDAFIAQMPAKDVRGDSDEREPSNEPTATSMPTPAPTPVPQKSDDQSSDLYSIRNFSV